MIEHRNFWVPALLLAATTVLLYGSRSDADSPRVEAVRTFADNVLEHARDTYRDVPTPLFVDGLNVDTLEPVRWVHRDRVWIPSNLASHQNLFRTLVALTNLTGQTRYRDAARDAMAYGFEHLQHENGLFYWGGHRFLDLASGEAVGEGYRHELKHHYPFYEFMWEVNPEATRRFLDAFWNAHIMDWSTLDMNRHGAYQTELTDPWTSTWEGSEPFFEGRGLTFINTGTDLIYAGAFHYLLTGEKRTLEWSKRLAEQYVNARHPETGLGVYQFSQLRDGRDRAKVQFGPEWGDVALEGWMIRSAGSIYGTNARIQLHLAELLGEEGREFVRWTVDGLRAWARYGYDAEQDINRTMWADGTDLTGYVIQRDGYYGSKGQKIRSGRATAEMVDSYALGHRLSGDPLLWEMARAMARHQGVGDIGSSPGADVDVDLETTNSDPNMLYAVLEICRSNDHADYRALAERLGENIIARRFHKGFFLPSSEHVNARVGAVESLALLALEAMLRGEPQQVPSRGGLGFFHGPHDGRGRTTDGSVLWNARR